jgi:hypothetical protein
MNLGFWISDFRLLSCVGDETGAGNRCRLLPALGIRHSAFGNP